VTGFATKAGPHSQLTRAAEITKPEKREGPIIQSCRGSVPASGLWGQQRRATGAVLLSNRHDALQAVEGASPVK
jgi:hypothetical protein